MIRQSIARRTLRASAPYTEPLPEPSGPLARPSTTHIAGEPTVFFKGCGSEDELLTATFDNVLTSKRAVHGDRLTAIGHRGVYDE